MPIDVPQCHQYTMDETLRENKFARMEIMQKAMQQNVSAKITEVDGVVYVTICAFTDDGLAAFEAMIYRQYVVQPVSP